MSKSKFSVLLTAALVAVSMTGCSLTSAGPQVVKVEELSSPEDTVELTPAPTTTPPVTNPSIPGAASTEPTGTPAPGTPGQNAEGGNQPGAGTPGDANQGNNGQSGDGSAKSGEGEGISGASNQSDNAGNDNQPPVDTELGNARVGDDKNENQVLHLDLYLHPDSKPGQDIAAGRAPLSFRHEIEDLAKNFECHSLNFSVAPMPMATWEVECPSNVTMMAQFLAKLNLLPQVDRAEESLTLDTQGRG
ncbi:hypothetical protein BK816_01775 [Boudabousia tangfeifanii]|uniref:Uncharacterized protein n=1 Tax=Boudabousia tangfeifanii TaxID=1912795 RepID=A0A1D9MIL8_9ACTO|nr:hypothetical protein [Boudabousia tangfeifanii]AOZ72181.1 hypothetical protein BK816_01775 [Boudabousia tangfeifanii]